jgi:diguanylate cyclase (GGDEF)-like protein/PAS domain S-box-containing protein
MMKIDKKRRRVTKLATSGTERKHPDEALRESAEKYRLISESTSDLIAITTFSLRPKHIYVSPSHKAVMGYASQDLIGKSCFQFIHPADRKKLRPLLKHYVTAKVKGFLTKKDPDTVERIEFRARDKTGNWHYLQSTVNMLGNDLLFISKDITERKIAEEALIKAEERNRILLENAPIGIYYSDLLGKFLYGNKKAEEIIGYQREKLTGKNFLRLKLLDPKDIAKASKLLALNRLTKATGPDEFVLNRKDKTKVNVEINTALITMDGTKVVLGMVQDITERKEAEEKIRKMAYHDALTGLPNRVLFVDRLKLAIAHAQRNRQKLAVMLLDLDQFKDVNDTHGHNVGDQLLRSVGKRLTGLLRKSDTVSRMGGDEFFLLLPELTKTNDAETIAQKIMEAFRDPFVFNGHKLSITTSIGFALYPDDGEEVDILLINADIAMYQAKQKGRDNYQRYTATMRAGLQRKRSRKSRGG